MILSHKSIPPPFGDPIWKDLLRSRGLPARALLPVKPQGHSRHPRYEPDARSSVQDMLILRMMKMIWGWETSSSSRPNDEEYNMHRMEKIPKRSSGTTIRRSQEIAHVI